MTCVSELRISKCWVFFPLFLPPRSIAWALETFTTRTEDIHLLSTELIEGEPLTPVCHSQDVIVLIPVKTQQNAFRH